MSKHKAIDLFFKRLLTRCKKKDTYSVIEAAEKMGRTYEEVQKYAQEHDDLADILEFCHGFCSNNTEYAGLTKKIPMDEYIKYMCENDIEFKEYYEKYGHLFDENQEKEVEHIRP